jgi:hypothetical protein
MKMIVTFFISILVTKFFRKCHRKNEKFLGAELVHYPFFNPPSFCLFLLKKIFNKKIGKSSDNYFLVKPPVIKILPQQSLLSRDRFCLPQQTGRHSGF